MALRLANGPVSANGEDIALFTCLALDEQGREVPDASPLVRFACTGPGRIVGTGSDNTDHVSVSSPERRMYAGRIAIAVKLGDLPGGADHAAITLLAQASSVRSSFFSMDVHKNR